VSSLNNIIQLAVPLTANEMFNNKTFEVDFKKHGFLRFFDIKVKKVHVNTFDGFTIENFAFKNNTNTLQLTIGGVNIDANIDGKVHAAWLIPIRFNSVNITNATMQIELSTSSQDDVHFKLVEASLFHVDDVQVKMKSKFWQFWVNKFHRKIMKTVKQLCTTASDLVSTKVDQLNDAIATEGPDSWMIKALSPLLPLNATMTRFLEFSGKDDLIYFNIDGRFKDLARPDHEVPENQVWTQR